MRGILKRVSGFILAVVMILQTALPSYAWYIPESEQKKMEDANFQYYLAEFLTQYPLLTTHMNANMLHRELFEELDKTTGDLIKFSDFYRTLTGSPLSFIDKKSKLYEQILNEIIEKNLQSEETQKQLNATAEEVRIAMAQELLQSKGEFRENFHESAEDLADILDIGMEFLTSTEEIKYFQNNYAGFPDKIKAIVGNKFWEQSGLYFLGIDILFATANNALEFCNGVAAYTAVVEYKAGVEEFLQSMKDNTRDQDLLKAIDNVLVKMECVTERDIAQALEENKTKMYWGEIRDLTGIVWKNALGVIGAGNTIGYLLTDIIYETKETESLHLLLEAELEIEDVIVQTLAECRASYHGDYDTAIALNAGTEIMYGAYEYGLDIIERYVNLINDIFLRGLYAEQKELVDKEMFDSYKNLLLSNKLDENEEVQEIFERLLKLNRGMIANGRSVFETMALAFKDEYLSGNKYKLFLNQDYVPVEGISLELPAQTVTYASDSTYSCKVTFTPENATNQNVNYTSTNTGVVEVDASGILKVKGTGTADIIVTSDDGLYTDRKVITVENEKEAIQEKYVREVFSGEEFDYTPFYEKNEDGITLKSMVWYKSKEKGRYVTSTLDLENYWGGYVIPAYIDGMPVTELDFNGQMPAEGQTVGLVEHYLPWNEEANIHTPTADNYVVVLSPTVKRIADHCFAGYYFGMSIELNEGLEYIGERAFYQCDLFGYWGSVGTVWSDDFWGNDKNSAVFVIPESVKEIGKSAFEEADFHWHSLEIRSRLEKIPERCFYGVKTCEGISLRYDDGIKVIGKEAFAGKETDIKGCAVLPASVERIEESAFENSTLELYELPENLVSIGNRAFANSKQEKLLVKDKTISEKVKVIEEEAFFQSFIYSATEENLEIPDSIQQIGAGAFEGNGGINKVISYTTEESIQYDGSIGNEAFKDCSNITQIIMPENIVTIGEDIISGCSAVEQVTLSQNTYHIEKQNLQGVEAKLFYVFTTASEPSKVNSLVKNQELPDAWIYNSGQVSFGRVDVPVAFAQKFNLGAFDELVGEGAPKIERLMIWGEVHGLTKGSKAKQWSDFVSGVVYALDEDGDWVCMYRESSEVETVEYSKGKFEDPDDYYLDMKELKDDYPAVKVPVGAGESNGSWEEGTEEQKVFEFFKEVYLAQENSRYMHLSLSAKEGSEKGKDYQVGDPAILKFEIPESWSGDTNRYAAYHIGTNGEIHRLQGSVEDKHFWALTYDDGYFALVELSKLEENVTEVMEGIDRESSISQQESDAILVKNPDEKSDDEKTQPLSKVIIEEGIFTITLWVDSTKVVCTTVIPTQEQQDALYEKLKLQKSEESENQKKIQTLEFNVSEKKQTVVIDTVEMELPSEANAEIKLYAFSVKEKKNGDIALKKVKLDKDKDSCKVTFEQPGTYWVVAVEKEVPNYETMWIIILVIAILVLNPRRKKKRRRKRV